MFRFLFFLGLITLVFGDGAWQAYVDDQLISKGFDRAAIIGHDGSVWAISSGFSLKAEESVALASLFKQPSNAFATGIRIYGIKYIAIKADNRSIYGVKGNTGIIIVKSVRAIIIAVYGASKQHGAAATDVEKLADYLIDSGY